MLKLCTGSNTNKEANSSVLKEGTQDFLYTVSWRQQYTCFRGGQPRYKVSKESKNCENSRVKAKWMYCYIKCKGIEAGREESLISNSYINQVNLKLSLNEWVHKK